MEIILVNTIVLSGFLVYTSTREHLLATLLSLEYMVVGLFLMMFMVLEFNFFFYSLFYLIITACEGALGLSILVIMSRSLGGDYFKSFGIV